MEDVSDRTFEMQPLATASLVMTRLSSRKLACMICPFAGLQLVFALIISNGTHYLRSQQLSQTEIWLTWASAPICGAFLQPCFGFWSDAYYLRHKRRDPFIIFGSGFVSISVLLLAWVEQFGRFLDVLSCGDSAGCYLNRKILTIFLIILLNISIQPLQVALRALPTDIAVKSEQPRINKWICYTIGIANVTGFFAGTQNLSVFSRTLNLSQFQCLALLTNMALIVTTSICLIVVRPDDICHEDSHGLVKPLSLSGLLSTISNASHATKQVLRIQFWSWMAWFPVLYYAAESVNLAYLGQDYRSQTELQQKAQGKASGDTYAGSRTTLIFSLVSLLAVHPMVRAIRPQSWSEEQHGKMRSFNYNKAFLLWASANFLLGSCLGLVYLVSSWQGLTVLFAIAGVSWMATVLIPHTVIASELAKQDLDEKDRGSHAYLLGLHNSAISAPQIIAAIFCAGIVYVASKAEAQQPELWALRAAAFPAFMAGIEALR